MKKEMEILEDHTVIISGNVIVEVVSPRESSKKLLEIIRGSFVHSFSIWRSVALYGLVWVNWKCNFKNSICDKILNSTLFKNKQWESARSM